MTGCSVLGSSGTMMESASSTSAISTSKAVGGASTAALSLPSSMVAAPSILDVDLPLSAHYLPTQGPETRARDQVPQRLRVV